MKRALLILSAIIVFLLMVGLLGLYWYNNSLGPISSNDTLIPIEVPAGSTYTTLGDTLESNNLIKSKLTYRIYLKLNPPKEALQAGTYYLSENMGVKNIIETLSNGGKSVNPDQITITFREGINMRAIAKEIASNTNNTEEDVFKLLKDKEYLKSLINNYWFIDDFILDDRIYYPLEGYLFPNTYNFKNKNVTVKEIFKVMLDEMEKQLEPLKADIMDSEYSFHHLATLASIIELESADTAHRDLISGVFYNRLNSNMSLGSDPTTYYGLKIDISERELTKEEFNTVNDYNTRVPAMSGKLPVSPICIPSIISLEAAVRPAKTDAYYFVADKNNVTYFTRTYNEHLAKIEELKAKGLWYVR